MNLMSKYKVLHVYKTFLCQTNGGIEKIIDELVNTSGDFNYRSGVFYLGNESNLGTLKKTTKIYCAKTNFTIASTPFSI